MGLREIFFFDKSNFMDFVMAEGLFSGISMDFSGNFEIGEGLRVLEVLSKDKVEILVIRFFDGIFGSNSPEWSKVGVIERGSGVNVSYLIFPVKSEKRSANLVFSSDIISFISSKFGTLLQNTALGI